MAIEVLLEFEEIFAAFWSLLHLWKMHEMASIEMYKRTIEVFASKFTNDKANLHLDARCWKCTWNNKTSLRTITKVPQRSKKNLDRKLPMGMCMEHAIGWDIKNLP